MRSVSGMQKTALLSFALAATAILGVTKVNSQEYIQKATGTIVTNNADGTILHKVYFGFKKFNPVTNLRRGLIRRHHIHKFIHF